MIIVQFCPLSYSFSVIPLPTGVILIYRVGNVIADGLLLIRFRTGVDLALFEDQVPSFSLWIFR